MLVFKSISFVISQNNEISIAFLVGYVKKEQEILLEIAYKLGQ